jgi:hypothetical protein
VQEREHDDLLIVRRAFAGGDADDLQTHCELDQQIQNARAGENRASELDGDERKHRNGVDVLVRGLVTPRLLHRHRQDQTDGHGDVHAAAELPARHQREHT